ncbi:MAG TPA: hypothetical protein VN840_10015 [Streptosporangiaceae bacterium]|nr:hypothetical protein [Streptosporangiaceae bacterium]
MRKSGWLLVTVSSAALLTAAAVQGVAVASTGHRAADHEASSVLRFHTMAPVTGPYVGTANPLRAIPGGGLPWIIRSARGSLDSTGHLVVRVRGLVLADQTPVPVALQGTNPLPDFRAVVSCQSIGPGDSATIVNVATGDFVANSAGDSTISASVNLPSPCIAPIVFVTGPGFWLAATGG